jgi:hypothetical protein
MDVTTRLPILEASLKPSNPPGTVYRKVLVESRLLQPTRPGIDPRDESRRNPD